MEADIGMGRVVTIANRLRSLALSLAFSRGMQRLRRGMAEVARRLRRRPHAVSAFIELDDPYSYLLCSYLREFTAFYDVQLGVYLTEALSDTYRPAPQLYPEYAQRDCRRLARELGIPFLDRGDTPPVEHRRGLLAALAARQGDDDFDEQIYQAVTAYWRGDSEAVARRARESGDDADAMLARNQRRLKRLGHYNTAMLHYAGEWYWGVDRLHYLIDRLDALGARTEAGLAPRIASISQVMRVDLPVKPPAAGKDLPPIELFFSFRSPYSYLSLEPVFRIADAFGVRVDLRPVMPMAMRGMPVPRTKLKYIVTDASREARRRGVPFGRVADPIGPGVERLMAVFPYAAGQRRERDFVLAAGRAVWSRAVDVTSDKGLRKVTAKAGLFWPEVVDALADEGWRRAAEKNRAAMMAAGSWGVPTVRVGDFTCWGQDRDWLLARHLEERCDGGEGILI
ncbi:MAG: DsbA family protein [Woeseiaceae bacterium]|nr:DsbA family protein [Woeseiaceae bacterium]